MADVQERAGVRAPNVAPPACCPPWASIRPEREHVRRSGRRRTDGTRGSGRLRRMPFETSCAADGFYRAAAEGLVYVATPGLRQARALQGEPDGTAPNAARVLAAAIGNCLFASLVFCLKRAQVAATGVTADVDVEIVRNEHRRLRVGKVSVTLHTDPAKDDPVLTSCLETFEDFCIVTQRVRQGIDVVVQVQGRS